MDDETQQSEQFEDLSFSSQQVEALEAFLEQHQEADYVEQETQAPPTDAMSPADEGDVLGIFGGSQPEDEGDVLNIFGGTPPADEGDVLQLLGNQGASEPGHTQNQAAGPDPSSGPAPAQSGEETAAQPQQDGAAETTTDPGTSDSHSDAPAADSTTPDANVGQPPSSPSTSQDDLKQTEAKEKSNEQDAGEISSFLSNMQEMNHEDNMAILNNLRV